VAPQDVGIDGGGGDAGTGTQASTAAGTATQDDDGSEFPELTCQVTPHPEWKEIKLLTYSWFGNWRAGVVPMDKANLQSLLDVSVRRLHAVHSKVDECGMGRLCMTLLAMASGEGTLKSTPAIHSPLLTILLDVPWGLVMRSGWPIFALLAQLHLHRHLKDDLPTTGRSAEYLQGLTSSLAQERPEALHILGAEFVRRQEEALEGQEIVDDDGRTFVMPALCALASQLLNPGIMTATVNAEEALRHMQGFYRQAVNNIDDLQATVESAWPLYGLLNVAALRISELPAA